MRKIEKNTKGPRGILRRSEMGPTRIYRRSRPKKRRMRSTRPTPSETGMATKISEDARQSPTQCEIGRKRRRGKFLGTTNDGGKDASERITDERVRAENSRYERSPATEEKRNEVFSIRDRPPSRPKRWARTKSLFLER